VSALESEKDPAENQLASGNNPTAKIPKNDPVKNRRKGSENQSEVTKKARVIPKPPKKFEVEGEFGKMIMDYVKEADKVHVK
jgi:hypothetical protein